MTLPASGNPISFSQVDVELGLSATAQISLNCSSVRTLFGVASGAISMNCGYSKSNKSLDYTYTWPGTYSWIAPACYSSVSALVIGGGGNGGNGSYCGCFPNQYCSGGAGGGGGALAYSNNISVTSGTTYKIVVGSNRNNGNDGSSYFAPCGKTICCSFAGAQAGQNATNYSPGAGGIGKKGTYFSGGAGGSGGTGGNKTSGGGGGAAGYSGNGGTGGSLGSSGSSGSGGGGAGGNGASGTLGAQGGGGVGFYGSGSSGSSSGAGGSGGNAGFTATSVSGARGGFYGGGGGGNAGGNSYQTSPQAAFCSPCLNCHQRQAGASGLVRIVAPGSSKQFPSTSVGQSSSSWGSSFFTICGPGTPSTYFYWIAPPGVTSISVLAIGAGSIGQKGRYATQPEINGSGGGGGALAYKNNISVTPGQSYVVAVGRSGSYPGSVCGPVSGGSSWFCSTSLVAAIRPTNFTRYGGTFVGDGGGNGGAGGAGLSSNSGAHSAYGAAGGGGAGGYSGTGGAGSMYYCGYYGTNSPGGNGSGGAGGGGKGDSQGAGGGGGVGFLGQGTNGSGQTCFHTNTQAVRNPATAGSPVSGFTTCGGSLYSFANSGGSYGGGGSGGNTNSLSGGCGGNGLVRIVWPGCKRKFPSTCVGTFP